MDKSKNFLICTCSGVAGDHVQTWLDMQTSTNGHRLSPGISQSNIFMRIGKSKNSLGGACSGVT
eukprot:359406-Chlamydomonas_euryale.AAC.1